MTFANSAAFTTFQTRNGFVGLGWNERGVSALSLPAGREESAEAAILRRFPQAPRGDPSPPIAQLICAIKRYFEGEKIDFSSVPVDLGSRDPFFLKVYSEVRKLGWGETTTYGAVAKTLGGEPQAARDVGQAMATNPVPLIVPCHRVLAAGGKIGGFSAPGGAGSKVRMLEIEGVTVAAEKPRAPDQAAQEQTGFSF
jgi:methylated-DNA-[protein]-cysteine S-methyltransferase